MVTQTTSLVLWSEAGGKYQGEINTAICNNRVAAKVNECVDSIKPRNGL